MNRTAFFRTGISVIPIAVLVILLAFNVYIFGSDAILGASQVALLFASGICIWLAMRFFRTPWKAFEEALRSNMGDITGAIVILFFIGAISGTWVMSGIIPTLVYYGVRVIAPKVFLLTACIICAVVSVMIGSSWTTIATVGVALLGIGRAEGFSDGMIAGAIISGAYFGDKISPLSDTTVMASSISGTPLFEHIRYMFYTTVPSMVITVIVFTVLGLVHGDGDAVRITAYSEALASRYNISLWLMIVPLVTAFMIIRKTPALIVLGISVMLAAVAAVIFQPDVILEIGRGAAEAHGMAHVMPQWQLSLTGIIETVYNSVSLDTGNPEVNKLVASRGMLGMLNTVYLVICAMCFGGCMRASGMLDNIARLLLPLTRTRTGLVAATVGTGTVLNGVISDQYLAIIMTSNIYKDIFESNGYENRLLSRSVEDSATVTSPLYPWSSCGMTQATILGVPTLVYFPYCIFNLCSPIVSITVAAIGYKIVRRGDGKACREA